MRGKDKFRIKRETFRAALRICAGWLAIMMLLTVLQLPVYADGGHRDSSSKTYDSSISGNMRDGLTGLQMPADDSGKKEEEKDPVIAQIDTSSENPCITWFVHGIRGRIEETEVYVGAEKAEVSEAGRITNGYPAPKTLVLIDNSLSIGTIANQEKIKTVLTRLIWNHQADEKFAIKTFSREARTIRDYTDDYDDLCQAVEEIEYRDQGTALRNVLYKEISDLLGDGELDYCRIILISDGTDNSRVGVTYEELINLISRDNGCFPIYTIGCYYRDSVHLLDRLYALSRLTGSHWYSLDDFGTAQEAAAIADEIRSDGDNATYFRFSLPTELKDGSRKNVGLYVKTSQEEYSLSKLMLLPQGTVKEMQELEQKRRAAQQANTEDQDKDASAGNTEVTLEQSLQGKMESPFGSRWRLFLLIPVILLLMLLWVLFRGIKKQKEFHEINEKPDGTGQSEPLAPSKNTGEQISLIDMGHPERVFYVRDGEEAVIGRTASRSDIAFPEDKMLAARHALISLQDKRAVLDSLGHGDDTFVKGKNVEDTVELSDGDVIELGNTRLKVRF